MVTANPEVITIHYRGMEDFQARPVRIGSFCDKNPTLPASMQEAEIESSRLLTALEERHEQSRQRTADAISFADFGKGETFHV